MTIGHRLRDRAAVTCAVTLVAAGALMTWGPGVVDRGTAAVTREPGATAPSTAAVAVTPQKPARPARSWTGPRDDKVLHHTDPGVPQRLFIPSLGIDAPVVPIVDQDDALTPPSDPQVIGWWDRGARPGAVRGSALLTGHTVHTGGGALDHLGDLELGARVVVRTARERMPYVVRKVRVFAQGRLRTEAARLFDQRVQGRLVLVTCADWNGEEYLSNVVVTAMPSHSKNYLRRFPSRWARFAPAVFPL